MTNWLQGNIQYTDMICDLKNINKIFFVGIGGISVSALAKLLVLEGKTVAGSDRHKSKLTKQLEKIGIKVFGCHRAKNVRGFDLVCFSGAVESTNPEIDEAKKCGIAVIERSELLQMVCKNYANVIAVAGSHGKTTITAMIGHVFSMAGLRPTVHVGGEVDEFGGNILVGEKKFFITEACEFRDSFLKLNPTVSVVSNVEPEHLDYFVSFENEKRSFCKFAKKTIDCCFVCDDAHEVFANVLNLQKIHFFGSNGEFVAKNIHVLQGGTYEFDVFELQKCVGRFWLGIAGRHNVKNALAAIAVCRHFEIDFETIKLGLQTFVGVRRRFEKLGEVKKCTVIQDYAHHPTEIACTIHTCGQAFGKKIVCVFQPHTYSRTRLLIDKFKTCFDGVDELYLLQTYSAREKFDEFGSANFLAEKIEKTSHNFELKGVFDKKSIEKQLLKHAFEDCVLLFLGAGDIDEVPKRMLKNFGKKNNP